MDFVLQILSRHWLMYDPHCEDCRSGAQLEHRSWSDLKRTTVIALEVIG